MYHATKISIITPTFNAAATIAACIESVATQNYPEKEHWIIDGASTDNTIAIVQQYAAVYPHIRYLSEKDKGIYDAMNKGIALSEGEWLYFLGADDQLYTKDTLETVAQHFGNNDVIYGNVQMINDQDNNSFIYDGAFDILKIQYKNICHQAIFCKRSVFHKLGNFNLSYPINADWEFNFKWIFNKNIRAVYTDTIIAWYNQTGVSYHIRDVRFKTERDYLILKYGRGAIPEDQKSYMFYTYVLQAQPNTTIVKKLIHKVFYLVYKYTGLMPAMNFKNQD